MRHNKFNDEEKVQTNKGLSKLWENKLELNEFDYMKIIYDVPTHEIQKKQMEQEKLRKQQTLQLRREQIQSLELKRAEQQKKDYFKDQEIQYNKQQSYLNNWKMNQQPFNIFNDQYSQNIAGQTLKNWDLSSQNHSLVRGINLANLSSSGFNLINGQSNKLERIERSLCEQFKNQIVKPKRPVRVYPQLFYDKYLPENY